jgi:phage shock protein PspC (stress-responsive transcriptional regulator)
MKEITRIHIAKKAYDIELDAKKQLEKYLASLETYTQDAEILEDIEIRITELLNEAGVKENNIITSKEVSLMREQLGEPHEFSDDEGDIAVGAAPQAKTNNQKPRRLYRSPDTALLGGVLGGIALYLKIDPLWARLGFVLLLFISFGFAALIYALLWMLLPAAKTSAQKLQLTGQDVTAASIKQLALQEDEVTNTKTPILLTVLSLGAGVVLSLGALLVLGFTLWLVIATLAGSQFIYDAFNGFAGLGDGLSWLVWTLFWVVVVGLALLVVFQTLIAYAFFKKSLSKKLFIGILIIAIAGIASAATVIGISSSQSVRIANETRSMVRDTTSALPADFASVKTVTFGKANPEPKDSDHYFSAYPTIRYVADSSPMRYELTALPDTRASIKIDGTHATISIDVSNSFRNSFVQPLLTIYGPALTSIDVAENAASNLQASYESFSEGVLTVSPNKSSLYVSGSYSTLVTKGSGNVEISGATINELIVEAEPDLSVSAGTVGALTVTQPIACPAGGNDSTIVRVAGITASTMTYNGTSISSKSHEASCGRVIVGEDEYYYE